MWGAIRTRHKAHIWRNVLYFSLSTLDGFGNTFMLLIYSSCLLVGVVRRRDGSRKVKEAKKERRREERKLKGIKNEVKKRIEREDKR